MVISLAVASQGWLDDTVSVGSWQGVGVEGPESRLAGRVCKLSLPKNRINGPLTALAPLTNMRKLSLWQNSIPGDLTAIGTMVNGCKMVGCK